MARPTGGHTLTTPPTPDQLAETLDELAVLWPALPAALARDAGTSSGERVSTSENVHTIPLNADVASTAAALASDIPLTAAWASDAAGIGGWAPNRPIPTYLRALAVHHDRLVALGRSRDAARLATTVDRWHKQIRDALGLNRADRPLRAHCPRHDNPLTALVEPGDRGWLRYDHLDAAGRPVNPWVSWLRHEAVTCRHCDAIWSPGQYLWLGRLIDDADQRRAAHHEQPDEAA